MNQILGTCFLRLAFDFVRVHYLYNGTAQ